MLRHASSFLFHLNLGSNEPEAANSWYLLPPTWCSRGTHLLSQYVLVPIVLFCVMSFKSATQGVVVPCSYTQLFTKIKTRKKYWITMKTCCVSHNVPPKIRMLCIMGLKKCGNIWWFTSVCLSFASSPLSTSAESPSWARDWLESSLTSFSLASITWHFSLYCTTLSWSWEKKILLIPSFGRYLGTFCLKAGF